NDGWPDLYVANDAGPNYLYRNRHDGTFEEMALLQGAALSGDGQELGSMGVDWGDYDHDGRLDMVVTNLADQSNDLYRNLGGLGEVPLASRRGAAFGDINNDGNMDVVLVNVGEPPTLLINEARTDRHRVLFQLRGTKSNRAAIGARVTIHTAAGMQFSEVHGG